MSSVLGRCREIVILRRANSAKQLKVTHSVLGSCEIEGMGDGGLLLGNAIQYPSLHSLWDISCILCSWQPPLSVQLQNMIQVNAWCMIFRCPIPTNLSSVPRVLHLLLVFFPPIWGGGRGGCCTVDVDIVLIMAVGVLWLYSFWFRSGCLVLVVHSPFVVRDLSPTLHHGISSETQSLLTREKSHLSSATKLSIMAFHPRPYLS